MPRFAMVLAAAVLALVAIGARGESPSGFLYQLDGIDVDEIADSPFPLVVVDESGGEGPLTAEDVARLRDGGRRTVLAYLSIGEAEDFRSYWQEEWRPGSPSWLGPENPRWRHAYRVRYWEEGWRRILFGSEEASLDRLLALGFDGAYLDRVDAYEYWGPKKLDERPTAAEDAVALVRDLAGYARARRPGFLVFPQNALGLVEEFPEYIETIDGAGAEETWWRGNRKALHWHTEDATRRLDLLVAAGKTALVIDYPKRRKRIDAFYAAAEAKGYVPYRAELSADEMIVDPRHLPGTGPGVVAVSPADGTDATPERPPLLVFEGSAGAVEFRVSFAVEPSFRKTLRLPRGRRWSEATSLAPTAREWRKILRRAARKRSRDLWWWVTARDAEGRLRSCRARHLALPD